MNIFLHRFSIYSRLLLWEIAKERMITRKWNSALEFQIRVQARIISENRLGRQLDGSGVVGRDYIVVDNVRQGFKASSSSIRHLFHCCLRLIDGGLWHSNERWQIPIKRISNRFLWYLHSVGLPRFESAWKLGYWINPIMRAILSEGWRTDYDTVNFRKNEGRATLYGSDNCSGWG